MAYSAEGEWDKRPGDFGYASDANYGMGWLVWVEAAEAIAAGEVCYIHLTDGKAYVSGTGTQSDYRATGIAERGVASGATVYIRTGGVYNTSGLTDKEDYYLSAGGTISTTVSTVRIGTAISTTELLVDIRQDDSDMLGTIKPWAKTITDVPGLTAFWRECDGTAVSDTESPLNGQNLPDLNSTQRFLRGSTSSGTIGGSDSHAHSASSGASGSGYLGTATSWLTSSSTSGGDTRPAFYEVVFIIKVK